jgi:alkylation response protein AidB-like acyl-CoA dehydrogenase
MSGYILSSLAPVKVPCTKLSDCRERALDFAFSKEDEEFRDEVRSWLDEHLVGEFREHLGVGGPSDDIDWEIRVAWENELASARLLNISWPERFGGRGGTVGQEIIFMIEHFRARAPYWAGIHGRDLFGPLLLHYGSEEQKQRFLPPITRVEEFWGQGFSEPDAGSDLAGLSTRAVLSDGEWVINGQKIWMTLGMYADWMYVLCRTDPTAPRHRGLSLLLVPAHQPGIDVRPITNLAHGREFAEVFFTNATTSADLVVGEVNGGWGVVMGALGAERGGSTVVPYIAKFEQEMEETLVEARRRGRSRDPVMRQRLASAWITLQILRYNTYRMLSTQLRNGVLGAESSIAKIFWSEWHLRFGELMMDVFGPDSLVVGDDYGLSPMQRSFLNARAETIYGGAAQIQRNIVGEQVLGLPKEPR